MNKFIIINVLSVMGGGSNFVEELDGGGSNFEISIMPLSDDISSPAGIGSN